VSLAGIFLRDAHGIEVELVFLAFREPENRLMAPAEAATGVDTMAKGPDNSIPEMQVLLCAEDRIDESIKRNDHAVADVMPDLPAETSSILQCAYQERRQSLVIPS
jgi:hypothetical protein